MSPFKIILIPGNGSGSGEDAWFPYVKREFERIGIPVFNPNFPEPRYAPEAVWLPFLKETLKADEDTILIGHSSGAVAAMRCAEEQMIYGSVLVSACYTDLGDENERRSGYFDTLWNWETIKAHQRWIIQFASTDDPFIPIAEARYIHEKLDTEYEEYGDQGHFGLPNPKTEFPELVGRVRAKLSKLL